MSVASAPRRRVAVDPATAALVVWLLVVGAAWAWGMSINRSGGDIMLHAPPFYGTWDLRLNLGLAVGAATAASLVWAVPIAARRASWRVLLGVVAAGALAWWLSLTLVDGLHEIERPLLVKTQYIHTVGNVGSPGEFLRTFADRVDTYPSHVRAHPPLMVLVLWGLAQIGAGGAWWAAALILLAAATALPAVLITVRVVAGEATARRAAPFLVMTPAALSIATTADAFYMAVGAWAVTATVVAIDRRCTVFAVVGGLLFGLLLFCSYGLVLLAAVPLAFAVARRQVRELVIAALGVLTIVGLFAAEGFWILDGFTITRREYRQSVAMDRPYGFFLVDNLAAFSVWLGPAVIAGLCRLRDRRLWLLAGGALLAVALADVSGLSKAEVERIWLPFLPWIVVAAAALPVHRARAWLTAQAGVTLVIVTTVNTLW